MVVVEGVITGFIFVFFGAALVFSGSNPAHLNNIGCIDSACEVTEVTRGKTILQWEAVSGCWDKL